MNAPTPPADTPAPSDTAPAILPCLADRWSPRSFADRAVEPEKLQQLFEAARWAASAFNEQPWRFIVATQDDADDYAKMLGCLVEANQAWAKHAPVLMIAVVAETFTRNNKPNRCAEHDLGLAMGNLCAQATALGLALHQMAGIDQEKCRTTFNLPADHHAFSATALGYPAPPQQDADPHPSQRTRNPLAEFVFAGTFGQPAPLLS